MIGSLMLGVAIGIFIFVLTRKGTCDGACEDCDCGEKSCSVEHCTKDSNYKEYR